MSDRIKLTEEFFRELEEFRMTIGIDDENHPLYRILAGSKQILDDYKKSSLFDSLLIENQTTIDQISQVKIANKMYEEQNKLLKDDLKFTQDNLTQGITNHSITTTERDNLKQKLEKIQKLVNDKDFLVTRRQLVDILKEIK